MKETDEDKEENEEEGRGADLRWLCGSAGGCWPESCLFGGWFFFFSAYFPYVLLLLFYSGGGDIRGRSSTGGGCCNFLLLPCAEGPASVFPVGRSSLFCLFCLLCFQCSRSQWQRCWWWNEGGRCGGSFFSLFYFFPLFLPISHKQFPNPFSNCLSISFSLYYSPRTIFLPPFSQISPCIYRKLGERVTIPCPSAGHGDRGMGHLSFLLWWHGHVSMGFFKVCESGGRERE